MSREFFRHPIVNNATKCPDNVVRGQVEHIAKDITTMLLSVSPHIVFELMFEATVNIQASRCASERATALVRM